MFAKVSNYKHLIVISAYLLFFGYWGWLCYCQGYLKRIVPTLPEANQVIPKKTFRVYWNPVSCKGAHYICEVSKDKLFKNIVFTSQDLNKSTVKISMKDWDTGSYYWRVAAEIDGKKMPWSWVRKFNLE